MQITFILGNGCNLNCTYCFEQNKLGTEKLKFEYAKTLLDDVYGDTNPFHIDSKEPHILEFVGGEPLLYTDLMSDIVDYFLKVHSSRPLYSKDYSINIITNGSLLDTPKVIKFFEQYGDHIELNCSIDGIKVSHDKFRLDKNGNPTYDRVWNNFLNAKVKRKVLKWTLTADTAKYYSEAIKKLLEEQQIYDFEISQHFNTEDENLKTYGYKDYSKCICDLVDWYMNKDPEWVLQHPYFMRKCDYKPSFIADYSFEAICTGNKVALDPDGSLVKCICASMVSIDREDDLVFGHVINTQGEDRKKMYEKASSPLYTVDAIKQTECYRCPIGIFCGNCYVSNRCYTGNVDGILRNPCNMHALKHLEHVFFNNYWIYTYLRHTKNPKVHMVDDITMLAGKMFRRDILLPKCWALEVVPEEVYDKICHITEEIGGMVSPLTTKFYTESQVHQIGETLAKHGKGTDNRLSIHEYEEKAQSYNEQKRVESEVANEN